MCFFKNFVSLENPITTIILDGRDKYESILYTSIYCYVEKQSKDWCLLLGMIYKCRDLKFK
jgi:hypothetical protein